MPRTKVGRCESMSPIAKFDEGPRRCEGKEGHDGPHYGHVSDGRHVEAAYDYVDYWNDDDQFVPRPRASWEVCR